MERAEIKAAFKGSFETISGELKKSGEQIRTEGKDGRADHGITAGKQTELELAAVRDHYRQQGTNAALCKNNRNEHLFNAKSSD